MRFSLRGFVKAVTPPVLVEAYRKLRRERASGETLYVLSSGETYYSGMGQGGLWDEVGQLQFDFMVANGLRPHHRLLDIGCGSLRGGVHFVRYLDEGNYYGMDSEGAFLRAAREIELPRYGLSDRTVHLVERDDFDFAVFGVTFDYALAQSVFTHLSWNGILRCMVNVEKVLSEGGKFYVTYFEDPDGTHRTSPLTHRPGDITTYPDQDPFHYEFRVFEELAARVSLQAARIGDWEHPKGQKMMRFTRRDAQ